MWEIYDTLIAGIPESLTVQGVSAGYFWTCVQSELGVGVAVSAAMSFSRPFIDSGNLIGKPVREVGKHAKSWNLIEAAIGMAAINSYYNSPEIASGNGVKILGGNEPEDRMNDPYIAYQNDVRGKNVVGVGHSEYLSSLMSGVCNLAILDDGDCANYPLDAADAVLPSQDYVYLPCTAFTTKQISHWLELSQNGIVIVCGPTVPMAPELFDFGIADLSGFIVRKNDLAMRIASAGENCSLFTAGEKVSLRNNSMGK